MGKRKSYALNVSIGSMPTYQYVFYMGIRKTFLIVFLVNKKWSRRERERMKREREREGEGKMESSGSEHMLV